MEVISAYEELAPRGIAADRTLLTTTWLMVAVFLCVLGWEVLMRSVVATSRRAQRVARLRQRASEVVQRELQRHQERTEQASTEMENMGQGTDSDEGLQGQRHPLEEEAVELPPVEEIKWSRC